MEMMHIDRTTFWSISRLFRIVMCTSFTYIGTFHVFFTLSCADDSPTLEHFMSFSHFHVPSFYKK